MSNCPVKIDLIYDEENIGDSLTKINQNFTKILSGACLIEQQLENMVNIRTFFYYGPNAPTESEATWAFSDYSTARPANGTIEDFVNDELKIPAISEVGDIAYVIYQKTGWLTQTQIHDKGNTGSLPFQRTVRRRVARRIGIGSGPRGWRITYEPYVETYYAGYSWSIKIADTYDFYSPTFVIYRLTCYGESYKSYIVDSGFPKFTQASTASTNLWKNPELWTTY